MKGELTSFFFLIYCCQHHRKLQASRFSNGKWRRDSPIRIPLHQCNAATAAVQLASALLAPHARRRLATVLSRAQAAAAIFIGEEASTPKFCELLLQ